MSYITIDGQEYTQEEYFAMRKQIEEQEQGEQQEASRLVRELGQAYQACKDFMEKHPGLVRPVDDAEVMDQRLFDKLRANLDRADEAPRCEKVKEDGTMCGSPQMRGYAYCYAHERMLAAQARKLELPAQEDANSIQMAVMLVQRALIDDEISEKKAGLLLYSLQIAASNVGKTTFGQADDEDLVTEMPEEAFDEEATRQGQRGEGQPEEEVRRRLPLMSGVRNAAEVGEAERKTVRGYAGFAARVRVLVPPESRENGLG